jgi:hypothetical protein
VNASEPTRVKTLNGFWPARAIQKYYRTVTIMHENTVRPRLQQIAVGGGALLVDIAATPLEAAEHIANYPLREENKEIIQRAKALVLELKSRPASYWVEYNKKAAGVKTTLDAVGLDQAVHLLRHGYLSAAVVCHAHFGSRDLRQVPDDQWFYNLVVQAE